MLMDQIQDQIITMDMEGRIAYVNAAIEDSGHVQAHTRRVLRPDTDEKLQSFYLNGDLCYHYTHHGGAISRARSQDRNQVGQCTTSITDT
jgi:hypothetical protein